MNLSMYLSKNAGSMSLGLLLGCVGVVAGWELRTCVHQQQEVFPLGQIAQGDSGSGARPPELEVGFASSPQQGFVLAERAWQQGESGVEASNWPRWRAAWLAGVCADSLGEKQHASEWMCRFEQDFSAAKDNFAETDVRYLELVACRSAGRPTFLAGFVPFGLFGLLASDASDPLPQVLDELQKARSADVEGDVLERVRLMSWLLLAGELIVESDEGTPSAGLLRNAIEAFDEGFGLLEELEQTFADDPSQERILTSTPDNALVAMRYDAVRVRQVSIKKRESLAKEKEFERLDSLRELIAKEKSVMGQVGRMSFAVMNRDWRGVRDAGQAALGHVAAMQEIARRERDYYLLEEPDAVGLNKQWSAIDPAVPPVSSDIVSGIKSLMGLASAKIAEDQFVGLVESRSRGAQVDDGSDQEVGGLLDEAARMIEQATAKTDGDPAEGFDPDNAIAPYVQGVVSEVRSRLATYKKIGDSRAVEDARNSIREASDAFEAVEPKFEKWGADVSASHLIADAQQRAEALGDEAPAVAAATALSKAGRAAEAWQLLGKAAEVHATKKVILDRADAARRSRQASQGPLAELDRAEASRMMAKDDIEAAIVRAGLVLQDVGVALAQREQGRPVERDREQLVEQLSELETVLRKAIEQSPPKAGSLSRGWAWLALCLAYETQVLEDQGESERLVKESQRLAKDALFEFDANPPEQAAWDPGYVEAVVAAQLALGHAAVRVLPPYRDESRLAFAAAIDNASSLPFNNAHFRMLGSPLLSSLASGGDGGEGKLAQEERSLRQMMTRFVEASFALRFGEQHEAALQMEEAVRLHADSANAAEGGFDASAELARADGFDAHISLPDTIRAFAALSQTNAGEPESALRTLLAITSPDNEVPATPGWVLSPEGQKVTQQAIETVQSPLAAFALAVTLEEVVDGVELSRVEEVAPILELAGKAQSRTSVLLDTPRIAGRYPHIVSLNNQLGLRLSDPVHHQDVAAELRGKGDVAGAIVAIRSAIRRQPRQQSLWKLLFTLEIGRLSSEPSAELIEELRAELLEANQLGLLNEYQRYFYSGELSFLSEEYAEAALQFDQAAGIAETELERGQAFAKATLARLRVKTPVAISRATTTAYAAVN